MGKLRTVMVVLALVAGACGNSDGESAGSGGTSDTTMEEHAAEPEMKPETPSGSPSTSSPDTCAPQGNALAITASGTAFDVGCLAAPAGQAFTIALDNKDSVPHNVAILESHDAVDVLFRGDILQGPKSTTYEVPALKAGTYAFHCEVHPGNMKGIFVVA